MGEAEVELNLLRTSAHVHIILLLQAGAPEHLVLVVASLDRFPYFEVFVRAVSFVAHFILVVGKVVRVHRVDHLRHLLPSERAVEVNLYLAFRAALGGHDDDTVGTTGTVDGS